jgi:hypothetical protein
MVIERTLKSKVLAYQTNINQAESLVAEIRSLQEACQECEKARKERKAEHGLLQLNQAKLDFQRR